MILRCTVVFQLIKRAHFCKNCFRSVYKSGNFIFRAVDSIFFVFKLLLSFDHQIQDHIESLTLISNLCMYRLLVNISDTSSARVMVGGFGRVGLLEFATNKKGRTFSY
jgi:hypothetical protein